MRLKRLITLLFLLTVVSLITSACVGPVWSTADIMRAQSALDEANQANATELAPYEYTRAEEMLRKARELWGYSQFGTALDYAGQAKDMAERARRKAQSDPWKGPPTTAVSF